MCVLPLLFGTQNRPWEKTWEVVEKAPYHSPRNWEESAPSQDIMQFGDGGGGRRVRGSQLFPVKHCGVNTGKGYFVKGSGKVQVEGVWLTLGGKPLPKHEHYWNSFSTEKRKNSLNEKEEHAWDVEDRDLLSFFLTWGPVRVSGNLTLPFSWTIYNLLWSSPHDFWKQLKWISALAGHL